jgi:hypothetical protein
MTSCQTSTPDIQLALKTPRQASIPSILNLPLCIIDLPRRRNIETLVLLLPTLLYILKRPRARYSFLLRVRQTPLLFSLFYGIFGKDTVAGSRDVVDKGKPLRSSSISYRRLKLSSADSQKRAGGS